MSIAAKHRKKAAEFEQLGQIDRAIASYVRAIEESELAGDDVDVALLNKVGDLALRQGRVPDALTYYERAVEHYANAGLFNNAIALCNKILRNAPGRANVYFTLGRICARKGLRGDATRNFLEYATRMQQEELVDEGMRALAEVADLMPELTEVRRLVDEHADRAGIVLPRRRTPSSASLPISDRRAVVSHGEKSPDLVFLEVDYGIAGARRTPVRSGRLPTPRPSHVVPPRETTQAIPVRLPGLEAADDLSHVDSPSLEGVTPDDPASQSHTVGPATHLPDVTWLPDARGIAGVRVAAGFQPTGEQVAIPEPRQRLDDVVADDFDPVAVAVDLPIGQRSAFRIDPHDFILPGELPPLMLDDALVAAGLDRSLPRREAGDQGVPVSVGVFASPVAEPEPGFRSTGAWPELDALSVGRSPGEDVRPVLVTPAIPIAAIAAEATLVASSRRDSLRAAVAKSPQDWLLRRRLAEALFEAGERDAGLAELEAAQHGLMAHGDFSAGAEIADTLVQVAPERVALHQRRVELAVRLADQGRMQVAYLDLADALVRVGEESRARAVYARVLEIDPSDDRARAALGAVAPPPAPRVGSDGSFVNLADLLRDDDAPASTRLRMREPAISGDEQADFDALLRHFKEGVARSLEEDDHESHYDLGVAFKEMGLLDDAVEEFQKALRSRSHRLPAYEALGQCFVEQGRHQVAATVLSRALHEPGLDDEQRVGVLYLLAYSCEALQRLDEARSYYHRVYATDIHFRDAAARLAALDQVAR